MKKKSLMSVFELPLCMVLFSLFVIYFSTSTEVETKDFSFVTESLLDSIYLQNDYRDIILNEDLSSSSVTEDWTGLFNLLNKSIESYEIVVYNLSTSKNIITCESNSGKYLSKRVVALENNTNYKFRIIELGLCY